MEKQSIKITHESCAIEHAAQIPKCQYQEYKKKNSKM